MLEAGVQHDRDSGSCISLCEPLLSLWSGDSKLTDGRLANILQKDMAGPLSSLVGPRGLLSILCEVGGGVASHHTDQEAFRTYCVKIFQMAKGQCDLSNQVSTVLSHWFLRLPGCTDGDQEVLKLKKQGVESRICSRNEAPSIFADLSTWPFILSAGDENENTELTHLGMTSRRHFPAGSQRAPAW